MLIKVPDRKKNDTMNGNGKNKQVIKQRNKQTNRQTNKTNKHTN